jgi:hypothetical protein
MLGKADGPRMPLRCVGTATLGPNDAIGQLNFSCSMNDAKIWNWKISVKSTVLPCTHITYHLHETFRPNVVDLGDGEELGRTGWGYFDIPITMHFVDGSVASFTFKMNFDAANAYLEIPLKQREVK